MKKVLYIGGFDMPDKNAAAQRVLGVGKLLRSCGVEVAYVGLSRTRLGEGVVDGFKYINLQYPSRIKEWIDYLIFGWSFLKKIKDYRPDIVIFYNHPALAIERLNSWCHQHNIKTVGDITEWYLPTGNPIFKFIKTHDTERRMRHSHLKLDGLINISRYLDEYYSTKSSMPHIIVPPLVDLEQPKWTQSFVETNEIKFVYAGSPGSNKDRLDLIIKAFAELKVTNAISLAIIGITKKQFTSTWANCDIPKFVTFHGRISHEKVIKELLSADFQIFIRPDNIANRAGFPTKFAETITSRTLAITNLSSNLKDYLENGKNGFTIESVDAGGIAYAISTALSLSKEQINELKSNIDWTCFDYHRYQSDFQSFLNALY